MGKCFLPILRGLGRSKKDIYVMKKDIYVMKKDIYVMKKKIFM